MVLMSGYRFGGGVIGNVASQTINVLKSAIPYVDHVLNRVAASGGMNMEDIEDSKIRRSALPRVWP